MVDVKELAERMRSDETLYFSDYGFPDTFAWNLAKAHHRSWLLENGLLEDRHRSAVVTDTGVKTERDEEVNKPPEGGDYAETAESLDAKAPRTWRLSGWLSGWLRRIRRIARGLWPKRTTQPRQRNRVVTSEPVVCSFTGCQNEPESHVQWGHHRDQQGILCAQHAAEVWKMIQPSLSVGPNWWTEKSLEHVDCG